MGERKGDWMQTANSRVFWPLDPRADEVFIEDIAHSLSLQCRYAGHSKVFYSVGEHSVRVARLLHAAGESSLVQLEGLLHDAAEAYVVDLPRPVKRHMHEYAPIEAAVDKVIRERFGLPAEPSAKIKWADEVLLATEKRDVMGPAPRDWELLEVPLPEIIVPWSADLAESCFLLTFNDLSMVVTK